MAILGQMDDPRRTSKGNLRHPLADILFLVISAVVSGCNDWESIIVFGESQLGWLRKYFPYKYGIPSEDTLYRVFSALDTKVFSEKLIIWTQELCKPPLSVDSNLRFHMISISNSPENPA